MIDRRLKSAEARSKGSQVAHNIRVVIPLYNGASTIADQLDALASQRVPDPFQVVVADNGSTDDGPSVVRNHPLPRLRLVHAGGERGQHYARNVGARQEGCTDILLFCDQDDVVASEWIAGMVEALEHFHLVGGSFDISSRNSDVSANWRTSPGDPNSPLAFASGANLGIRREVFDALGGFRASLGGDDVDLCWRAQLAGYSLGYAPRAIVSYRFRPTLRGLVRQQFGYGRAEALLAGRFSELQLPPPIPWWRELGWLGANSYRLLSRRGAGPWLASLAHWSGSAIEQRSSREGTRKKRKARVASEADQPAP